MKNHFLTKSFVGLMASLVLLPLPAGLAWASDDDADDANSAVTAADLGASESTINNAASEKIESVTQTGTLIEIGNTTAENTTVIIRTNDESGQTEDQTVEVETTSAVMTDAGAVSDLSDWIAGDQITFTANHYTNSGALVAKSLKNRSLKAKHYGRNGWVKAIRLETNEMDVEWNGTIYTLNTSQAKLVAGAKNPATLSDFQVGDRIRGRVVEDNDGNPNTWKAEIIVVLRRGNDLFMRVTRWVTLARITAIPEDITLPTTIEVEVLPSKFYEAGDVNNLIGAPGEKVKVDITDQTHLVRKFFGKCLLKEFSEGDEVRIISRRDESTGHLVAKFIKNDSIQMLGVANHLAAIEAIDTSTNTIEVELIKTKLPVKKWTVRVQPDTVIYRYGQKISLSDLQAGEVIRVVGTANTLQYYVTAQRINVVIKKTATDISNMVSTH